MNKLIETGLLLAGVGQFILALVNLNIVRILDWKLELECMPLLIREVFQIHTWFISITLAIFATLTCRFTHEIALGTDPVCRGSPAQSAFSGRSAPPCKSPTTAAAIGAESHRAPQSTFFCWWFTPAGQPPI